MRLVAPLVALLVLLACAPAASAQGCIMCRQTAAAGGAEAAKALDLAVLVLLIPTVLIFVGVLAWALRYRNRSLREQDATNGEARLPFSPPLRDSSLFRPLR